MFELRQGWPKVHGNETTKRTEICVSYDRTMIESAHKHNLEEV